MSGSDLQDYGDEGAWQRAITAAMSAATPDEALAEVLQVIGPMTGAVAGAVLDRLPYRVRATWECSGADLAPLADEVETLANSAARAAAQSFPPYIKGETAVCLGVEQLEMFVAPLRTPAGAEAILLFFFLPGSELTAVQQERRSAAAVLCALLVERDALAEEARRARQARDHFLVAIHHELRTPATAIMLEAGLLQSGVLGELPPRMQKSLARLESQTNELTRLVRQVLDLAQLEAAAEPLRGDLVDPRKTIVELGRRVEPIAERKGVTLSLYFPRTLPLLQTDGERFRRILLYLLANALKYTEEGRVDVRVERTVRTFSCPRSAQDSARRSASY